MKKNFILSLRFYTCFYMQNQPSNSIHEHIVAQPHLFNYLTQKKSAVLKLDANRNILKVNIFCGLDALTY